MWEYVSIALACIGFVASLALMLAELRVRIGALSGHLDHPGTTLWSAVVGHGSAASPTPRP